MVGGSVLSRLSWARCVSLQARDCARTRRTMSTYIRAAAVNSDLRNASEHKKPTCQHLPARAKVVICGGGAQGAAIAYKLALAGWGEDVVLIEQVKQINKRQEFANYL